MIAATSIATVSGETCQAVVSAGTRSINNIKSAMGFGTCDLQSVFDYRDSPKDVWINCELLRLASNLLCVVLFRRQHPKVDPGPGPHRV